MLLSSQHGGLGVDLHFQDQEGACGRGMGMKTGLQRGRVEVGAGEG